MVLKVGHNVMTPFYIGHTVEHRSNPLTAVALVHKIFGLKLPVSVYEERLRKANYLQIQHLFN